MQTSDMAQWSPLALIPNIFFSTAISDGGTVTGALLDERRVRYRRAAASTADDESSGVDTAQRANSAAAADLPPSQDGQDDPRAHDIHAVS